MAKIKRAGKNFLNFFKGEEILPSEFNVNNNSENFDNIQNTEFYINF